MDWWYSRPVVIASGLAAPIVIAFLVYLMFHPL